MLNLDSAREGLCDGTWEHVILNIVVYYREVSVVTLWYDSSAIMMVGIFCILFLNKGHTIWAN